MPLVSVWFTVDEQSGRVLRSRLPHPWRPPALQQVTV
jgi:hypothetical protein